MRYYVSTEVECEVECARGLLKMWANVLNFGFGQYIPQRFLVEFSAISASLLKRKLGVSTLSHFSVICRLNVTCRFWLV